MLRYGIRKFLWHGGIGVAIWLILNRFSALGQVYAGWFAGLLGACYLLAGWLDWLKSRGTDLGKLLRRKRPPEVPYYLRGADKSIRPKLGIGGNRHTFEDDLSDGPETAEAGLGKKQTLISRAGAFAAVGVFLLALSAF